jgi:hypothetical protein
VRYSAPAALNSAVLSIHLSKNREGFIPPAVCRTAKARANIARASIVYTYFEDERFKKSAEFLGR